jgi:hypothetical protein
MRVVGVMVAAAVLAGCAMTPAELRQERPAVAGARANSRPELAAHCIARGIENEMKLPRTRVGPTIPDGATK